MSKLIRMAFGALTLALSACASQTGVIRPIDGLVASGPEFVDITANSATLLATTEVDVACAVVYGPTTEFGMIATDTDMAGGAHSDHRALLTGLQPDTLYYARLQGSDINGALYSSEILTFRTAPADATERGENLALLGHIAAVSSNFGGGGNDSSFGANNAVDGDPGSEWSSDGDGDGAWIEIGLEAAYRVTSLGFWTRTMGDSAEVESFQVVTDQGETYGPYQLSGAGGPDYFETDFVAQMLRFEVVSSSGGNTGAVEIEIYGESAGP